MKSLQVAAIPLLDLDHIAKERVSRNMKSYDSNSENLQMALQVHFKKKRDHVLKRLGAMGLKVAVIPHATFYIWLDLEGLPSPLNKSVPRQRVAYGLLTRNTSGLTFFEELLKHKTIVVPGIFFEINPAHRRDLFKSPCHHFVRISIGPPLQDLDMGAYSITMSIPVVDGISGLDAMEAVLGKVKNEGVKAVGHSYSKSLEIDHAHAPSVH